MPGVPATVALGLASPPVTVITIPIDEPTTTSQVSTTTISPSTTAATTPPTTTATTPPTTTAMTPPTTTATTVEVAGDGGAVFIFTGVVLAAVLVVAVIILLMRHARRKRQVAEPAAGTTLTERVRELSEQAMMESAPDRLDDEAIAELYPWISTDEGIIIDPGDDDALASPDRNHDSRGRNGSS